MPFDATPEKPKLDEMTTDERREFLIETLRDPDLKENQRWDWDYTNYANSLKCTTSGCAVGLMHHLWPHLVRQGQIHDLKWHPDGNSLTVQYAILSEIGAVIGLNARSSIMVFLETHSHYDKEERDQVSAAEVADFIEHRFAVQEMIGDGI